MKDRVKEPDVDPRDPWGYTFHFKTMDERQKMTRKELSNYFLRAKIIGMSQEDALKEIDKASLAHQMSELSRKWYEMKQLIITKILRWIN